MIPDGMEELVPKPTLSQTFKDGPPRRNYEQNHNWLTAHERRFILWGLMERWPATRIGAALGVNEATVRRFRRRYWEDPGLILELGLYEMAGRAVSEEYRCLVCEERVISTLEIQRHVVSHFVVDELVNQHLPRRRKRGVKRSG